MGNSALGTNELLEFQRANCLRHSVLKFTPTSLSCLAFESWRRRQKSLTSLNVTPNVRPVGGYFEQVRHHSVTFQSGVFVRIWLGTTFSKPIQDVCTCAANQTSETDTQIVYNLIILLCSLVSRCLSDVVTLERLTEIANKTRGLRHRNIWRNGRDCHSCGGTRMLTIRGHWTDGFFWRNVAKCFAMFSNTNFNIEVPSVLWCTDKSSRSHRVSNSRYIFG